MYESALYKNFKLKNSTFICRKKKQINCDNIMNNIVKQRSYLFKIKDICKKYFLRTMAKSRQVL